MQLKMNADLKSLIKGGAYLVDVRTPAEFATGSVPGAVNIPLDEVAAKAKDLAQYEAVVLFCRSGNRSGMAKALLEQLGLRNVTNGGIWMDVADIVASN